MTAAPDIRSSQRDPDADTSRSASSYAATTLLPYLIAGTLFGIVLVKSEVLSWFRIQEMFRFQAFHMYGIIGSAFVTAAASVRLLRWLRVRSLGGEKIDVPPKQMGRGYRYWVGGTTFGVGWVLTGACPGPLFALVGSGASVFVVAIVAALAGTWTYGLVRAHLPH